MSTQNVNVARFARNVEWDFSCDFQTPCLWPNSFKAGLRLARYFFEKSVVPFVLKHWAIADKTDVCNPSSSSSILSARTFFSHPKPNRSERHLGKTKAYWSVCSKEIYLREIVKDVTQSFLMSRRFFVSFFRKLFYTKKKIGS